MLPGSFVVCDRVIAIIDDEALVRDSVQRLVRSMGFEAVQFSTVSEFLASPSKCNICCIISDVNMPCCKAGIRDLLASIGNEIPIIFMTARRDQAVEAKLMNTGAVCVLAKPFNQMELASCIDVALQRRSDSRSEPALQSPG